MISLSNGTVSPEIAQGAAPVTTPVTAPVMVGGINALQDTSAPPQIPSAATPDTSAPPNNTGIGGANALNLPPPPPRGGVSEDLRTQMMRAANTAAQNNPNPNSPSAWARNLLAGAQTALAGVGAVGKVPEGAGGLYGAGKAMQYAVEQRQKAQAAAAQQKQQAFENNLALTKEQREEEVAQATIAATHVSAYRAARDYTTKEKQDFHDKEQEWVKPLLASGAEVVSEGLTSDQLADQAQKNGIKAVLGHTYYQDGLQPVLGKDGKPQVDANGDEVVRPTYALVKFGEPVPITQDLHDQIKTYLNKDIPVGTTLEDDDFSNLKGQVLQAVTRDNAINNAIDAGEKNKAAADEAKDKAGKQEAATALLPWMSAAKNDPGEALQNMQDAGKQVGPDGKPTPDALKAQDAYNKVSTFLGEDIIKSDIESFHKQQEADQKAAADKVKNQGKEPQGDLTLSGDAYLNSVDDVAHRSLIKEVANNQIPIQRWEYIVGRGSPLADEVAAYDKNFNSTKAKEFQNVYKDFLDGPASKAINAGGTALDSLDRLAALATPAALISSSPAAKAYNNQLITTATEVAKFLVGGGGQPTEKQVQDIKDHLGSSTPWGMRTAIKQQAKSTLDKYGSYLKQWSNGLPNPTWNTPMPGMDPEAIHKGEKLANERVRVQPNAPPSAPIVHQVGDVVSQNGRNFTVTGVDANGQITGTK